MKSRKQSIERWKRDLLWVVNSPDLLSISVNLGQQTLSEEDFDLDELTRWCCDRKQSRVGLYFEELVHFYLQEHMHHDMLLRHHQVFDGKRTLGEIDFVYRDQDGVVTHLETTVKFFLYHPTANGFESHYIGPNSADNLHLKTSRLLNHQLPLSEKLSVSVQRRAVWCKGRVFYNPLLTPEAGAGERVVEPLLNPSVGKGIWAYYKQIPTILERYPQHSFAHLRKPHWLALESRETIRELWDAGKTKEKLVGHFENQQSIGGEHGFGRPVLLAIIDELHADFEIERLFVVPDAWPYDRPSQILS